MKQNKKLELYGTILGFTKTFNEDKIFLYAKIRVAFNDEYNEKRDSTPVRELKIHRDNIGQYVIHKYQKLYL